MLIIPTYKLPKERSTMPSMFNRKPLFGMAIERFPLTQGGWQDHDQYIGSLEKKTRIEYIDDNTVVVVTPPELDPVKATLKASERRYDSYTEGSRSHYIENNSA